MASATLQIPYLDVTTVQSAGVSPFFGGVQMYWTAEAQTRTETEPQFKQMELKAWELSGYSVSSNVLLQDSTIGLEKFLMQLFAMSIAWFEEYAFLQGNRRVDSTDVYDCLRLCTVWGLRLILIPLLSTISRVIRRVGSRLAPKWLLRGGAILGARPPPAFGCLRHWREEDSPCIGPAAERQSLTLSNPDRRRPRSPAAP
jgi:hypothetical protein